MLEVDDCHFVGLPGSALAGGEEQRKECWIRKWEVLGPGLGSASNYLGAWPLFLLLPCWASVFSSGKWGGGIQMNCESIPDQSFADSPSHSHEQAGAESFSLGSHWASGQGIGRAGVGERVSSWTISAFELCGLRTSLRFPLDAVLLVGILPQDKSRRKRWTDSINHAYLIS